MPDVHGRTNGLGGIAPKIAIGAAVAALLTSLAAVVVVTSRGGGEAAAPPVTSGSGSSREDREDAAAPSARRVAASDVVRLRREAVTLVRDAGKPIGVKITDEDLRRALDVGEDDVITAIAGRAIEREYDVLDAMFALKRLRPSTIHVELLRGGRPVLVRWALDGELQTARAPDPDDPRGVGGIGIGGIGGGISGGAAGGLGGGSLGGGGLGGGYGMLGVDPRARDPLADTIRRLDDTRYEVPRSTIARVFAAPATHAGGARALPARRTTGFRVYAIRPGTLAYESGIKSGDTIRAINGNGVGSIQEVVDLYPQIKDAREWRIDLERRGKPMLITIAIK
ncbi:MAG TPA: PDZ domain-containing protein [Kofleriaceae bacterium]|nr:PDZ domain-containing protein [Kofleriaceae bacterium]